MADVEKTGDGAASQGKRRRKAKRLPAALRAALFATVALGVSGCESMNSMKDRFSGIQWPTFSSSHEDEAAILASRPKDGLEAPGQSNNGCPPVNVMPELAVITQFMDETVQRADNMVSMLRMTRIDAVCTPQDSSLAIDLTMSFEGDLGPKAPAASDGAARNFVYPYFIAVMGKDGSILAKEVFAVSMTYNGDQTKIAHTETVRQVIPGQGGFENVELMAGFQLTDAELAYNRSLVAATPRIAPPEWPPGIIDQAESTRVEPVSAERVGISSDMPLPGVAAFADYGTANATQVATAAAVEAASAAPAPVPASPPPLPGHKPAAPPQSEPEPEPARAAASPAPEASVEAVVETETIAPAVTEEDLPSVVTVAPEPAPQTAPSTVTAPISPAAPDSDGVVEGAEPPSFPPSGTSPSTSGVSEGYTGTAADAPALTPTTPAPAPVMRNDDEEWSDDDDDITAPM